MLIGQKPICENCQNFLVITGVSGQKYPRCLLNIMPVIIDKPSGAMYLDCAQCPAFVVRPINNTIKDPQNEQ